MSAAPSHRNDLFASLISDIKSYSGDDPLLPWLRGIKAMKESLPAPLLKEKLPRFLQKCAQTFESDRRYKDDIRYFRVWLQLMDYVDDPRVLLKAMETNGIGTKRSLFYQAYALYYEKAKKYEEAEKMYLLGLQNHAEPANDLRKSYEQFLHRMGRNKYRKNQMMQNPERKPRKTPLSRFSSQANKENINREKSTSEDTHQRVGVSDDTVVAKFVDTAIVGKPQAEDARHHGLVEPTINMKEAISTINSMFSEPIETVPLGGKRTTCNQLKEHQSSKGGFTVFVDEDSDEKIDSIQPQNKAINIYIDDEENIEGDDEGDNKGDSSSSSFVFLRPMDIPHESCEELGNATSRGKFREDTVVCRFVGSAILDDPAVENVCHHGLVDPTINLKEAMEDINNMFGKPMDFVRSRRSRKSERPPQNKGDQGGFLILPDDDDYDDDHDEHKQLQVAPYSSEKAQNKMNEGGFSILPDDEPELQQKNLNPSGKSREKDLCEPTLFTKEAMDDINKLFVMPLDF